MCTFFLVDNAKVQATYKTPLQLMCISGTKVHSSPSCPQKIKTLTGSENHIVNSTEFHVYNVFS